MNIIKILNLLLLIIYKLLQFSFPETSVTMELFCKNVFVFLKRMLTLNWTCLKYQEYGVDMLAPSMGCF